MIAAEQDLWCVYVWRANWIGVGRWKRLARCQRREQALARLTLKSPSQTKEKRDAPNHGEP